MCVCVHVVQGMWVDVWMCPHHPFLSLSICLCLLVGFVLFCVTSGRRYGRCVHPTTDRPTHTIMAESDTETVPASTSAAATRTQEEIDKEEFRNVVPPNPASYAVELAGARVPMPPKPVDLSDETGNFKQLIHNAFRHFHTTQTATDRKTLASLAEMQMRLLIEADVPDQSSQLLAQLELHNDLVTRLVWDSLKTKSNGQRAAVNDMAEQAVAELHACLERQREENRSHSRWLKGVCDAKVDAARNAGDSVGDDVLARCEQIFERQREAAEAKVAAEQATLMARLADVTAAAEATERKLTSRIGVVTKMLNDAKAEVKKEQQTNAKLKYKFENDALEYERMKSKITSYESALADGNRREEKLEAQISTLKQSLIVAHKDVKDGKTLYTNLLTERDELSVRCNEMETVLAENADAAAGLQKRIAQAKELDRIHKDEVAGLQSQIVLHKNEAGKQERRAEDAVKMKNAAVKQRKKLEAEVQTLADETMTLRITTRESQGQLAAVQNELQTLKLEKVTHEEKKHQHTSVVFDKVKHALKVLNKLHKEKGSGGGGKPSAGSAAAPSTEGTDAKSLFEQAMGVHENAPDLEIEKKVKKHGKRLTGIHAELQEHLEDIHEHTEEHLTGVVSDKKVDLKAEEERVKAMKKAMEAEVRASIEVALTRKLKRDFHAKMEKQMRTRLEGEIGRRYHTQMKRKIEDAIGQIKMKPDAMRDALEAERRRTEHLEAAVQRQQEELMRAEDAIDAKARGSAELALLVKEKDMLLTELTLLVRAYKGEMATMREAAAQNKPPVVRPGSRASTPGFGMQRGDGAGSRASTPGFGTRRDRRSRSRPFTAGWGEPSAAMPQTEEEPVTASDEELGWKGGAMGIRRAQSASHNIGNRKLGARVALRTSTLGANSKLLKSSSTNTNLSHRPITAPVRRGRQEKDREGEGGGYRPDALVRSTLKDRFMRPMGSVDAHAIVVGKQDKPMQPRPQTAAVAGRPAIVFGGAGLHALAERAGRRR